MKLVAEEKEIFSFLGLHFLFPILMKARRGIPRIQILLLFLLGSAAIETYQSILRQVAYVVKSPMNSLDRTFSLVCVGVNEQIASNEIRVQVNISRAFPEEKCLHLFLDSR